MISKVRLHSIEFLFYSKFQCIDFMSKNRSGKKIFIRKHNRKKVTK